MPRAKRLVVHHSGQDAVHITALADRRSLPRDRRQERVRGADVLAVEHEHPGVERILDGLRPGHRVEHAKP